MGKKLTSEEFINICKSRHGDKYDYSKVQFINKNKKYFQKLQKNILHLVHFQD